MKYRVMVDDRQFDVVIGHAGRMWVDGHPLDVDLRRMDDPARYSLLINNRSYEAHLEAEAGCESWLMVAGCSYCARLLGGHAREADAGQGTACGTQGEIAAPLPGLLAAISVEVGQRVTQGQVVAVLESMKMNLELRAPSAGVVQAISGKPGCEVVQGQALVTIACEPDDANPAADR